MFSVIFEVHPRPDRWDAYLGHAKMLRPELEAVDGFVDNIRYASLTRPGWLLSLSGWRDEKALVRWRTTMRHHMAQAEGRADILLDYHLRVGEITRDTALPAGHALCDERLDETVAGEGTAVTLIAGRRPDAWTGTESARDHAIALGHSPGNIDCLSWDVFEAVLTPGDLMLLISWRTRQDAESFDHRAARRDLRLRHVRVIRDYDMFDRREAPQYYPDVPRSEPPA